MKNNNGVTEKKKGSTVEYVYRHSENEKFEITSASVEGLIKDGLRHVSSKSEKGVKLRFEIPLWFKLGTHNWVMNDNTGIRVYFDPSSIFPGHGEWMGAWGEFKILDDDFRKFRGEFKVYGKRDDTPPRLEHGHFLVTFPDQG
jgi:hypothetical protein